VNPNARRGDEWRINRQYRQSISCKRGALG
jgi:hypothetical protein